MSVGFGLPSGRFSEFWTVIVALCLTLGYYVTSYGTPLNQMNERMNANKYELRGRPMCRHDEKPLASVHIHTSPAFRRLETTVAYAAPGQRV